MLEAAKRFVDKECLIYLLSGEISGIIREVTDNAIIVETASGSQLVNLDFVVRIREFPKNKKGKKKAVVLDRCPMRKTA